MENFKDFYDSLSYAEVHELAEKAGTSQQYLYQLAANRRQAGADIIDRLMAADSRITFKMMRSSK